MLALCPPSGHAPLVLALAGLPGAGKSSLASQLAAATRWSIVDREQIRAQCHPGDSSDVARMDANEVLLRRVGTGVRAGLNVIVDGKTWARAADRRALQEVVDDAGGDLHWCWLEVPMELAKARVRASGHAGDDSVSRVAALFEFFPDSVWKLDASQSPDELLQELLLRLAIHLNAILIDNE
mgnify:CR=1 FL=1